MVLARHAIDPLLQNSSILRESLLTQLSTRADNRDARAP